METSERHCFHCGEPIPSGLQLEVTFGGVQRFVCCAGCQAVAQLISASGLDNYYRFRKELGTRISSDVQARQIAWRAVDNSTRLWGVELPGGQRELLLQTEGIRCSACAWLIRSHLESSPGIRAVQVDVATGFSRITWNPAETRLSRIAAALYGLGYTPHLPISSAEEQGRQSERRTSLKRLGIAGLGMMQVMMYSVGLYAGDELGISEAARSFLTWVSLVVTLPVLLYSGKVFFIAAWSGLRVRRPGMDVPVALAIGLAFSASCINFFRGEGQVWFDSVIMFIFFLTLGRHIELVLRHRNLQAGAALARLMPEWARRLTGTGSESIPSTELQNGDRVRVAAGEAFPADGLIETGSTEVDEALLTGESRPLVRQCGDAVIAGTVNLTQTVDVEVTATGDESTLSSLGRLLLTAQSRRASSIGMPDWLIPVFIGTVLTLAAGTWLYWFPYSSEKAFSAMLAVLVASCPCALSLALPAVYSAASSRLLAAGVLMTRGDSLHDLLRVDTALFDKTGTLTLGHPHIQKLETNLQRGCNIVSGERAMQIAAALEAHSAHPLAHAFKHAGELPVARSVKATPGAGLEGLIDGKLWRIGTAQFVLQGQDHELPQPADGRVWLGDGEGWYARFELEDALRPGARDVMHELSAAGIETSILSGDGTAAVDRVAQSLGVHHALAQQTAEMKLAEIHRLQGLGRTVLMAGDGVNDAPVLAAANVSITVKGATELANSTADLVLTGESLGLLNAVFEIAHKSARLIRQNLAWALLYNASIVPFAMSASLKPWMAALGMSLSSLVVVLNATRMSRFKTQCNSANSGSAGRPMVISS